MFKQILFVFILVTISGALYGQWETGGDPTVMTKAEIDKRYNENIKKTRIDGVYIPIDYKEAINEIKALAPDDGLASFIAIPDEDIAARKLFFGLGRWMALNWSFAEGSRLSHSIKNLGVVHQDDMIVFILTMLHRDLRNDTRDPKDVIQRLAQKRKEIARESIDKVISTQIKKQ